MSHETELDDPAGWPPTFVTGGLIAHSINNLRLNPPADHKGEDLDVDGCCPVCCAPCISLLWLRDNAPMWAGAAVRAATGDGWDWQVDGDIDWDAISERWARADTFGCHDPQAPA